MITGSVDVSDFDRAERVMAKAPNVLIEAMRRANMESSALLVGHIKTQKLRGQVLNRITGTLIRSWAAKVPPVREENAWLGGAGTSLSYAIAWEFGVDKTQSVQVRAHTRINSRANTYRKSAANYRRGGTGVVLASQGVSFVKSFTRRQHTKLKARPYARPSLEEIRDRVREIHAARIRKADGGLGSAE